MNALIKLYDYFHQHKRLLLGLVLPLVLVLIILATRLRYKEDIMDFLPVDGDYKESLEIYQQLSEAGRIVIIFEGNDPDSICEAIDEFAECKDGVISEVDVDGFLERLSFVHRNMPYFLTDSDYERLDTMLTREAISAAMERNKMISSMPGTGILRKSMTSDPLGLIPLSKGANGQYAGAQASFTSYNDYMMTADRRMGFCFYDTPYGSTESSRNAVLVDSLQHFANLVGERYPSVDVRLLGAPVISVGNARRIKSDCLIAIALSLILISVLLIYAFPRLSDIGLIMTSVGFGWLTGMAALCMFTEEVSAIVLGIGSVLIGVAVNYPLHLLVHQRYTSSVRQTLEEVISPLIIGNLTTVGAFLALIPLKASALRDLGIFSASMLIGTIFFCILVLPQMMSGRKTAVRELHIPAFAGAHRLDRVFLSVALCLTVVAAGYCLLDRKSIFDPNISHLNYMTDKQRADFAFFESVSGQNEAPAYLAGTAKAELSRRAGLWNDFWKQHDPHNVARMIDEEAQKVGFKEHLFIDFQNIIGQSFPAKISDSEDLAALWPGRFDSAALNARLATSLSDNFDYIGTICSLLVFVFLLLSFKSFTLALIAFMPMALSWVWIVALMKLTGLEFNIVNVILATFIFGQGDDYTIFILEGLLYELRHGKPMLSQYKQSIILSAIIMLVGIGVLIIARHPAMHSLGAVTLIGMTCVVIMAYIIPPFLLNLALKVPFIKARILS